MKPNSLTYRGCYLLSKFKRMHLTKQQRARDQQHADFVKGISLGQKIDLSDLRRYKNLSNNDANDPNWKYAPVLVGTNMERYNINRLKAHLWAKEHQTYVFKWRRTTKKLKNKPNNRQWERVIEEHAFFWDFFVPNGAPANLTKSLNPRIGLVNSAPLKTHSLTFSDSTEYNRIMNLFNSSDPPKFGDEIEIETPLSVNMQLEKTLDGKPVTIKRQEQLNYLQQLSMFTADNDTIVIPLTKSNGRGNANDYKNFYFKTGDPLAEIGSLEVKPSFIFDLGFSFTVHKAQGRTLPRVVIDLTKHTIHKRTMEYAAIFVAMSRTKETDHIRLLHHPSHSFSDAYSYLSDLKPKEAVTAFYNGFEQDNQNTLLYNWSPLAALDT